MKKCFMGILALITLLCLVGCHSTSSNDTKSYDSFSINYDNFIDSLEEMGYTYDTLEPKSRYTDKDTELYYEGVMVNNDTNYLYYIDIYTLTESELLTKVNISLQSENIKNIKTDETEAYISTVYNIARIIKPTIDTDDYFSGFDFYAYDLDKEYRNNFEELWGRLHFGEFMSFTMESTDTNYVEYIEMTYSYTFSEMF